MNSFITINKVFAKKIYLVREQLCTFILQGVKELKHFGTIAAPAEMQLVCKENTNLASINIPGLDLTILLIVIGLICSRCVFILYESNLQSDFRRMVFSVEYSAAVEMVSICLKLPWRSKHSQDCVNLFPNRLHRVDFPLESQGAEKNPGSSLEKESTFICYE